MTDEQLLSEINSALFHHFTPEIRDQSEFKRYSCKIQVYARRMEDGGIEYKYLQVLPQPVKSLNKTETRIFESGEPVFDE